MTCAQCKWMHQGKISAQCFSPAQTEKRFKDYTYWAFSCEHFEAGEKASNEEMVAEGYQKHAPLTVKHWSYWTM